jgi:hypothetical protein
MQELPHEQIQGMKGGTVFEFLLEDVWFHVENGGNDDGMSGDEINCCASFSQEC